MRIGFDDMMAWANVTVCLVCAWFFELAVLRAVQGWALVRVEATAAVTEEGAGGKEMA